MKILLISDETDRYLWDDYRPGNLDGIDLILSAGDLKENYLSFLVTFANCPLLYVPGNHDGSFMEKPPEGCQNIDGHLVNINGVKIIGLGGCRKYKDGPFQITEREMMRKIRRANRLVKKAGGVDIVIAHAPPRGLGDLDDPAHVGFEAFIELLDEYRPQFFLHGHTHLRFNPTIPREEIYGDSRVVNVSERYALSLQDREVPERDRNELKWISRRRDPDGSYF